MMSEIDITPEQYHAALDKLWQALDGKENGIDDVFTLCTNKIEQLQKDKAALVAGLEDAISFIDRTGRCGEFYTDHKTKAYRNIINSIGEDE